LEARAELANDEKEKNVIAAVKRMTASRALRCLVE